MEWKGITPAFTDWATRIDDKRLLPRAEKATVALTGSVA
jgi:hypothetical protein